MLLGNRSSISREKMDRHDVYADILLPGHMACAGCGEVLGLKIVLQAAGLRTIAVVVPSWLGIILGPFPYSSFRIPVFHAAFEPAASACACFPDDLRRKVMEAKGIQGMKYIHILSPCPMGWRYREKFAPTIGRLAVETNYFPLYEIRNGQDYTINHQPKNLPVDTYLLAQGRFAHLTKGELQAIQDEVDRNWDDVTRRVS